MKKDDTEYILIEVINKTNDIEALKEQASDFREIADLIDQQVATMKELQKLDLQIQKLDLQMIEHLKEIGLLDDQLIERLKESELLDKFIESAWRATHSTGEIDSNN